MNLTGLVFINGAYVPSSFTTRRNPEIATRTPTRYLIADNNLSDLADVEIARSNLGISLSSRSHTNLNHSHSGSTLGTTYDDYFVALSFGYSVYVDLPDVEDMEGRELTFINTTNVSEAWFTIYGPIESGDSFTLPAYGSLKILCDGTKWWITSYYVPS